MKLLFVTATRVGDAVLSTGLLQHLITEGPEMRVTIACGAPAAPLFTAVPGLDRIVVLEKQPLSLHWLRFWAATAGHSWDTLVDLRGAPITRCLWARRQLHKGSPDNGVHRVVSLGRLLGVEVPPPSPRLWLADRNRERANAAIPDGPPVLAIGPTANWHAKTWPADRFAALIKRLTGAGGILPGARVALFGHASEREAVAPLLAVLPASRCIDLIGRLDLLDVAACLQRATLYVGNDSGLMHMAAAVGVPTLGLFGPSRDDLYAPWGPLCAAVRTPASYADLVGPGYDPQAPGLLMDGLDVDRVEAAAVALWTRVANERVTA